MEDFSRRWLHSELTRAGKATQPHISRLSDRNSNLDLISLFILTTVSGITIVVVGGNILHGIKSIPIVAINTSASFQSPPFSIAVSISLIPKLHSQTSLQLVSHAIPLVVLCSTKVGGV